MLKVVRPEWCLGHRFGRIFWLIYNNLRLFRLKCFKRSLLFGCLSVFINNFVDEIEWFGYRGNASAKGADSK